MTFVVKVEELLHAFVERRWSEEISLVSVR